jgi:hypothetical protein
MAASTERTSLAWAASMSALILLCSASYWAFSGLPLPYVSSSDPAEDVGPAVEEGTGVDVPVEGADDLVFLPAPFCFALDMSDD